jgi:hypothetical protein
VLLTRPQPLSHRYIDICLIFSYIKSARSRRAHSGCDPELRSGCGVRARSRKPLPGGFGCTPGRHYDRSARSSLHWRRRGVTPACIRRFQEALPEAEPGGNSPGERRGGAPKGERAAISPRPHASNAAQWKVAPLGAPPPFSCLEANHLAACSKRSDAYAPRERICFPSHRVRGEGGARREDEVQPSPRDSG